MSLYGAAKAPAVPKSDDATTEGDLTEDGGDVGGTNDGDLPDLSGDGTGTDATLVDRNRDAIRELAAKINNLIEHMNDGRT